VDETPIAGNPDQNLAREVMGLAGGPAFARRARQVEDALEALVARYRGQREEWLPMVRLNLGRVFALAGDPEALRPLLASAAHWEQLCALHAELQPRLRLVVEPTTSKRALRRALAELRESVERFNDRWRSYLTAVDLSAVNELRDGYNRYYVMEKEAVVRSPRIARQGFVPLEPLTRAELAAALPLLPVPEPAA
jgi:hypothetical protein